MVAHLACSHDVILGQAASERVQSLVNPGAQFNQQRAVKLNTARLQLDDESSRGLQQIFN